MPGHAADIHAFQSFRAPSVDHVATRFLCGCCVSPTGPFSATCTMQKLLRHCSFTRHVDPGWSARHDRNVQRCCLAVTHCCFAFPALAMTRSCLVISGVTFREGPVINVACTCSTLSSLPMVSKQKTLPSSPRQYRYAPRGDSHDATKSPPSFFPDWKVFTTCRRHQMLTLNCLSALGWPLQQRCATFVRSLFHGGKGNGCARQCRKQHACQVCLKRCAWPHLALHRHHEGSVGARADHYVVHILRV